MRFNSGDRSIRRRDFLDALLDLADLLGGSRTACDWRCRGLCAIEARLNVVDDSGEFPRPCAAPSAGTRRPAAEPTIEIADRGESFGRLGQFLGVKLAPTCAGTWGRTSCKPPNGGERPAVSASLISVVGLPFVDLAGFCAGFHVSCGIFAERASGPRATSSRICRSRAAPACAYP